MNQVLNKHSNFTKLDPQRTFDNWPDIFKFIYKKLILEYKIKITIKILIFCLISYWELYKLKSYKSQIELNILQELISLKLLIKDNNLVYYFKHSKIINKVTKLII